MKTFLLLIGAAALAGCSTPMMHIPVDSNPPGARVYFGQGANEDFARGNRQYIGTTPFTWDYQPKGDGTFDIQGALVYSTFVPPAAVLYAEPPSTNAFPKVIVYHGGTVVTAANKVPHAVFFDCSKP